MCGIAGILKFDGNSITESELKRFTNSLYHRGPDAAGFFINEKKNIGFGHRRLSIIDKSSAADQPMEYANKQYCLIFNGEIYNYLELKKELESKGHKFLTNSDSEVLLASYVEWGESCQLKFNGMWAFAILDKKNNFVFLSRDRFGVKPLYYLSLNNHFFFASELKAFMHINKKFVPEFSEDNIYYFSQKHNNNSHVSDEDTILKNVKELNPGNQLIIKKNQYLKKKWWSTIDNLISVPTKYEDQIEEFRNIFFNACRLRLRSDVNLATSLSGGLDSSSIVATINQLLINNNNMEKCMTPYSTYILNYKNETDSELPYAISVVNKLKIKHKIIDLDLEKISPQEIIKAIYHQEEISGDEGLGPWLIYKSMSKDGIKVSIDGHGGDELLAGYSGYPRIAMRECVFPRDFCYWVDLLKINLRMNDKNIQETNFFKLIIDRAILIMKNKINVKKNLNDNYFYKKNSKQHRQEYDYINKLTLLNKNLYIDYHYKSMSINLKKYDKFSMAHGIETRFPFLDWKLATYMFSLPTSSKINYGFTKRILRDSMRNLLPKDVLNRVKKKGFHSSNSLFNKEFKNFILDNINSIDFLNSNIFDGRKIRETIKVNSNNDFRNYFKYIQISFLIKTFREKINNTENF